MTRAESPLVSLLQSYPADEAVVAFITNLIIIITTHPFIILAIETTKI